jgi:hypothetical protein
LEKLGPALYSPECVEKLFGNSRRPLERASAAARNGLSRLLWHLLNAFGTPFRGLSRFSKQFRKGNSRKFAKKVPKLAHLGYALSHGVGYKGKLHKAFSEQPKGC